MSGPNTSDDRGGGEASPRGSVDPSRAAKGAVRDQLLTARGAIPLAEIAVRAGRVAALLLAAPEVRRAATVAAYVSVGREPGTGALLEGLVAAGKRVVLPVLRPDFDLDWAVYDGPESLEVRRFGLLEPAGPLLGPGSIATPDAVLVPGLAVDDLGLRLGRGGGCYDRALARVPVGTFVCAVLNDAERVRRVPAADHDRTVSAAVTEVALYRFGLYRFGRDRFGRDRFGR